MKGQGELFPDPRPARQVRVPLARATGWRRYTPSRRVLCDLCVRDIDTRGWLVAPAAMPARWRRVDNVGESIVVCHQHKYDLEGT